MSGAGIGSSSVGFRPRDEEAFRWYFRDGQRRFQRSTHGAIVARLERDSAGCVQCRICRGAGILDCEKSLKRHIERKKTTEKVRKWIIRAEHKDVDGRDAGPILHEEETEVWAPVGIGSYCQFCKGTGVRPKSRPKTIRCPDCSGLMKAERQRCGTCHGRGRVSPDVGNWKGREESAGVEVDGDTLRRFAVISRRLSRVSQRHQQTIEDYFGPLGEYWGGHSVQAGRLVALQPRTKSGRKLLQRTRKKGDEATGATPEQRIDSQWALQTRDPKTWRYELLEASMREAQQLVDSAAKAWLGLEVTPGWRDVWEWLQDRIDDTAERVEVWNDEFRPVVVDWAVPEADGVYR